MLQLTACSWRVRDELDVGATERFDYVEILFAGNAEDPLEAFVFQAEISRSEFFIHSTPSRPWAFARKSEADALRQVKIKRAKEGYCPSTAKERNVAYSATIFRNAMYSGLLHQE